MFSPVIKKYAKKLYYDGAETDLIIALIEIIKLLPIHRLTKNEQIVSYISISIKNKYIKLSKSSQLISKSEVPLELINTEVTQNWDENNIFINELLNELSSLQRYIIINKYIYNYSDVEIAKSLKVSRQAVNRTKSRAIANLKRILQINLV